MIYKQLTVLDHKISEMEIKRLNKVPRNFNILMSSIRNDEIDNSLKCRYVFRKGSKMGLPCKKLTIYSGYCTKCITKPSPSEELYSLGLNNQCIKYLCEYGYKRSYNLRDIVFAKNTALRYKLRSLAEYFQQLASITKMNLY